MTTGCSVRTSPSSCQSLLSHTRTLSLSLSLSRAQPLNKHPHSSYYLTTITGRVPIETLKEEYSHFVPDVSIFTSSTLLYVITVCVREPVSHSQVVLPMEWVYGVMFRACEEQENLGFALELWNREGMRERVYGELGLCVWYHPCRHVEVPCQYSQCGDSVSVLWSHVQESVSLGESVVGYGVVRNGVWSSWE